jgi:DNA-binding MarR family transcriptional regulator
MKNRGDNLTAQTNGGFLISQIKQIQGRVFEKLLGQAGIASFNGAQGRILYVLWQEDFVPIVELSKKTGLAKNTLTSMLDRMERLGLITRIFDKTDRRQIRISLTDKAKSLRGEYDTVSARMSEIFYKGFNDGEITGFEDTLNRIIKNLTEAENE